MEPIHSEQRRWSSARAGWGGGGDRRCFPICRQRDWLLLSSTSKQIRLDLVSATHLPPRCPSPHSQHSSFNAAAQESETLPTPSQPLSSLLLALPTVGSPVRQLGLKIHVPTSKKKKQRTIVKTETESLMPTFSAQAEVCHAQEQH